MMYLRWYVCFVDHRKFVQSQQALNEIGDDDNTPYTSSVSPNAGASSRASSAIDVGHGGARRRQPSAHEEVAFKNKLRHMGKCKSVFIRKYH